jgi:hypothetical protein
MATYSVTEMRDLTSVAAVANWSEAKVLLYQATAESLLSSLQLDTTVAGYEGAYSGALVMLFDSLAENPTGRKSRSEGKVSTAFAAEDLPPSVRQILRPYLIGPGGSFAGASFRRRDIGLR